MNETAKQNSRSPQGYSKGIVYAGAGLTDIYPLTSVVPKALLPVYDKPLVYYALSVLMLGGIRRIALVTRPHDRSAFERLLGDGRQFGIQLQYIAEPAGATAGHALLAAADFIDNDCVAMIAGDCLLYGDGLQGLLSHTMHNHSGATVFAHPVANPQHHAVVDLGHDGQPRAIHDPPAAGSSHLAIMDVCFFDREVVEIAQTLAESNPTGFSLADIHRRYMSRDRLRVVPFGRGFAWLDTTTPAALNSATNFIQTIESTHGLKIACLEEIALQKSWLTANQVSTAAATMNNAYGQYLARLAATAKPA